MTDAESASSAATSIASSFPHLDILINNAGYLEKRIKIAESDPCEWEKTWSVNVTGLYLVTRAFLLQMLSKGGDSIVVNLRSIAVHLTSLGASAYQTSKLVVLRFTEFLDADHGPYGVLTFAVHSDGVLTDMGNRLPEQMHKALPDKPELCADTLVFLTEKRWESLAARYASVTWDLEELLQKGKEIVREDKLKVRMHI